MLAKTFRFRLCPRGGVAPIQASRSLRAHVALATALVVAASPVPAFLSTGGKAEEVASAGPRGGVSAVDGSAVDAAAVPAAPGPPAVASEGPPSGAAEDDAPVPPAPPAPGAADAPPPPAGRVPLGKGMWLYQLSQTGGAEQVVRHAQAAGLTHLYLRLGSSKQKGFYGQGELDRLLPVAHAGGLKVVGWDFPYLFDPAADAQRAFEEISYTTPDGHRIDAFSADIETAAEGVNLTAEGAAAYGARLRELVGPGYPMIATVPRPSPKRWFPFAEATAAFDAIAPMVYWLNRDPVADITGAIADLAPFGKPVVPIGQAYDGGPEGGPPGKPPKEALVRFMDAGLAMGALGVSFWAWHHVTPEHWAAVTEAKAWELPAGTPTGNAAAYLQRLLAIAGHPTVPDGLVGPATTTALASAQRALGLPATGTLDPATARGLLGARR